MSGRWVALGVAVVLGGLLWSNARFILLAIETEPGCVPHTAGDAADDREGKHAFRAAKSSC